MSELLNSPVSLIFISAVFLGICIPIIVLIRVLNKLLKRFEQLENELRRINSNK